MPTMLSCHNVAVSELMITQVRPHHAVSVITVYAKTSMLLILSPFLKNVSKLFSKPCSRK